MFTKQLSDILQNLQRPGDFYSTGTLETFPPSLEVKQVGKISSPLLSVQAEQHVENMYNKALMEVRVILII